MKRRVVDDYVFARGHQDAVEARERRVEALDKRLSELKGRLLVVLQLVLGVLAQATVPKYLVEHLGAQTVLDGKGQRSEHVGARAHFGERDGRRKDVAGVLLPVPFEQGAQRIGGVKGQQLLADVDLKRGKGAKRPVLGQGGLPDAVGLLERLGLGLSVALLQVVEVLLRKRLRRHPDTVANAWLRRLALNDAHDWAEVVVHEHVPSKARMLNFGHALGEHVGDYVAIHPG